MRYGSLKPLIHLPSPLRPARVLEAFTSEVNRVQGSRSMASSSVWEEKKALRKDVSKKLKQMEEDYIKQQSKLSEDESILRRK